MKEIEDGEAGDGQERVTRALVHLAKTGEFRDPPVVMKLEDGLRVIDGNHRETALVWCQANTDVLAKNGAKLPSPKQSCWMGRHALGEVPREYPEGL